MAENSAKKFKYEVDIKEIHGRTMLIESDTELTVDELRDKANELSGEGDPGIHFEYGWTMEPEEWTVKQIRDNGEIDYLD